MSKYINRTHKDMPEDNKMMASFRIDREDWNRFGELARMERLTATQLLTDYVAWCLERGKSQYGVRQDNDTSSHSFSTGNDDVMQILESRLSIHKDEVLTAVADKISTLSVPSGLDGEVLTPLNRSIEGLREALNELESYMMGNFEGLRESVKKLEESQPKGAHTAPSGEKHSDHENPHSGQTMLFEVDSPSPTSRTTKPNGGLTMTELIEKLGKTRQAIESRRNAGTLAELGYRAEQVGRSWYYLPIDSE